MSNKDFYQISLKVILKNNKGEILILKDQKNGSFTGFYDLPGGRIDEEEFNTSFTKIIKREIIEELGNIEIIIKEKPVALGRHLISTNITSNKKSIRVLYVFFEAELLGGKIKIGEEHTEFEWVNLNNVKTAKLFKSGILEGINMYLNK